MNQAVQAYVLSMLNDFYPSNWECAIEGTNHRYFCDDVSLSMHKLSIFIITVTKKKKDRSRQFFDNSAVLDICDDAKSREILSDLFDWVWRVKDGWA